MRDADLKPRVLYKCACGKCDTVGLVFLNPENQYLRLEVGSAETSQVLYLSLSQISHLIGVLQELADPQPTPESVLDC